MEKIEGIEGDLLKPNLGVSEQARQTLLKEVQVVFHVAATVGFDSPLKKATYINVRSTRDLLDIAKSMEKLEVRALFSRLIAIVDPIFSNSSFFTGFCTRFDSFFSMR